MTGPVFDRTGLAEEIADLVDGSESGEVRVRWTTSGGTRFVEVVRSGTWSAGAAVSDLPRRVSDQNGSGYSYTPRKHQKKRAAQRAAEVRKVLVLIETFGIDAVKLDQVRLLLGVSKTTAFHRLSEAREIWLRGSEH